MPKGFKVSCLLIVNMMMVANISSFLEWKLFALWRSTYHVGIHETIMSFSMQGEDILERTDGMCVMCLYLGMQEEDVLEHTDAKCHLCRL